LRERLRTVILDLTRGGSRVAAYGAAAKGVTLLNYLGIGGETLAYAVDRNVHKVGKYMPGLKLLVRDTEVLASEKPEYVLILAWNFGAEIMQQQRAYVEAGGCFILPIPEPVIVDSNLAGQIASSPAAPKMAAGIAPPSPTA
jgi:hypothetical protein